MYMHRPRTSFGDEIIGEGELEIKFTAHNINMKFKKYPGMQFPIPVQAFFYIKYCNTPGGSHINSMYTYADVNPFPVEETVVVTRKLSSIEMSNYLSFQFHLLAFDDDQWVKIDYIKLRCYTLQVNETFDPLASTQAQQFRLNFKQTNFQLDTSAANIRLYYSETGGPVTESCPYLTPSGSSNPFTINVPAKHFRQLLNGVHTYRIRFRDAEQGKIFWTKTMRLEVYDSEVPVLGAPSFNPSPNYREDFQVSCYATDGGGTGLHKAKICWAYHEGTPQPDQIGNAAEAYVNQGATAQNIHFTIPNYGYMFANVKTNFIIVVEDGRTYGNIANKRVSPVYSFIAIDADAPIISIAKYDNLTENQEKPGSFWGDLGYPGYIEFDVNDFPSGCGFDTTLGPYSVVKGYRKNGVAPTKDNYMFNDWSESITASTRRTQFGNETRISWSATDFALDDVIHVFIYAMDSGGNVGFETWNFTIVDKRAPDIELLGNTAEDVVYDQSKTLYIWASKNIGAASINTATAKLEIGYNGTGYGTPQPLSVSESGITTLLNWSRFEYTINQANYKWNTTVQIRFTIEDYKHNEKITEFSFRVIDIYDPTITLSNDSTKCNVTQTMRTFWNYMFCFNTSDQDEGAGVATVIFYYKNGSEAAFAGENCSVLPIFKKTGSLYYFYLPTEYIEEGGISVHVTVFDWDNNSAFWYFDFSTSTIIRPTVLDYSMDHTNYYKGQYYTNRKSMNFMFKLNTPVEVNTEFNGNLSSEGFKQQSLVQREYTLDDEGLYTVKVYYEFYTWSKTIIADFTAPNKVDTIEAEIEKNKVLIIWSAPTGTQEKVFYNVYRSTDPEFKPSASTLINTTEETFLETELNEFGTFYYKVVVSDLALNISDESPMITIQRNDVNYAAIIAIGALIAAGTVGLVVLRKKAKTRDFYDMPKPESGGFMKKIKNLKQDFSKKDAGMDGPANDAVIIKAEAANKVADKTSKSLDDVDAGWSKPSSSSTAEDIKPIDKKEVTDGWD